MTQSHSQSVTLIVDNRERHIIEKLEKIKDLPNKAIYQVMQLEIGDFHILVDGKVRFIIERKTVADLDSSIKDGRYREQKSRALSYVAFTNSPYRVRFMYVLEGSNSFNFEDNTQNNKILTSGVLNTIFRDDCPFIFTKNLDETVSLIACLMARIEKYATPSASSSAADEGSSSKPYIECLATRKKANIDKRSCFVLQLCCIPGISVKKAESIITTHNVLSIFELCEKMKDFKETTGISDKSGKSGKSGKAGKQVTLFDSTPGIGKVLAQTISDFLLDSNQISS